MSFESLEIQIDPENYKKLPSAEQKRLIFICNDWALGWNEVALELLLLSKYPHLRIISVGKKNKNWGKHAFQIHEKNYLDAAHRLSNTAEKRNECVFAIAIKFMTQNVQNWLVQKQLNVFFKTLKDANYTVVLIHFSTEPSSLGVSLSWKAWQKRMKDVLPGVFHVLPAVPKIKAKCSPPIAPATLQKFEKVHQIRRFLQSRLFAMSNYRHAEWSDFLRKWWQKKVGNNSEEIIAPPLTKLLEQEIAALRDGNLVVSQGDFEVFVAKHEQIPNLIIEIGRQRERTFRAVGEGTGQPIDLDDFDLYYRQLIVWDKRESCLVGGYRIGCGDEIMENFGVLGFYCSTLFKIGKGFQPILEQGLELGRSFVVTEYQKKPQPLFLLWKGILHFILEQGRYRYLFGPVSVSRNFSDVSRAVLVGFLKKYYFEPQLSKHLKPRKPFKIKIKKVDTDLLAEQFEGDYAYLEKFVEWTDTQRLPVLLRQYIRQNARFVGFNIDPQFSDCLDGFMLLDLRKLPSSTIENLQQVRPQTATSSASSNSKLI